MVYKRASIINPQFNQEPRVFCFHWGLGRHHCCGPKDPILYHRQRVSNSFIFLYTFSRFRINQTVFSSPFSRYRKEMQSFCGSLIRRQSSYIGHFKSARPCLAISSSYFHGLSSLGSDSLVLDENPASKNQIFRSFHHLASRSSVTSVCSFFGSYATF